MSPRIIHIPLSGGDRKHLKKQIDDARRSHALLSQGAAQARALGDRIRAQKAAEKNA